MKTSDEQKEHYRTKLREVLKPGDTVYGIVKNVSSDGMNRSIDLYYIGVRQSRRNPADFEAEPRWLSRWASEALGIKWDERRGCLRVSGVGMNMVMWVVNCLSEALFGDGTSLDYISL